MWKRLIGGEPKHFDGLDFSQSVNVILVTFGALVAVSVADFFDETKNKLPDDVRSWAILALLALLLRFIVGSAVHLNRTYNPSPQNPPDYANSPSILFFLKDIGFLIAFFLIDGILIIVLALQHRRELTGRWEWMMVGGVLDLVLALIIIAGLPGTLAWALGLLVGIDLVWGGMSLIAMALSARNEIAA